MCSKICMKLEWLFFSANVLTITLKHWVVPFHVDFHNNLWNCCQSNYTKEWQSKTLFLYLCELNGEELFAVIYIYKMKREVMWNGCKLFVVFYIQNSKREVAEELGGI